MTARPGSRPILVAEDSDEDFYALSRAFGRLAPEARIDRAGDGDEALARLAGDHGYGLLVLDLNLPGTDGREVLATLKRAQPDGWALPVIVLSSSAAPQDVTGAYRDGANAYVRKALRPDDYERSIAALKSFWLDAVVLPADCDD
ncbi:response regulator [Conexibacter sp. W3-3-2]|uniref:response regulator n=1 Tax=Conexibacter sp. W3-3-2 TaxID=2675227 RepID=UPI0012B892EF|nr:response regulator [Conexibacter sp. W3-3-2]MTD45320.1 response regulator [Conexibacter sp. W3-3-2]